MTHAATSHRVHSLRHRFLFAAVAVVLAFSAFAAVEAASAHLSAPSEAMPGQSVVVSGSGFSAGQSGNLTYNGGVIEKFKASRSGTFSLPFTIPRKAVPGRGRISAKTTSGKLLSTTTLAIVSKLGSTGQSAAPSSPPPSSPPPSAPVGSPSASSSAAIPAVPAGAASGFSHVYLIVFENHEYSQIVGSSAAPYINSLIARYGAASTFYGVRHPSEPNYLALVSGSTQGVTDDGLHNLGADNLFAQLQTAGYSWRAYEQGYPGGCFTGSSSGAVVDGPGKSGSYVRKHNPAISFTSVSGNPAECAKITNLASFDPAAAAFNFITPNLINDMHDGTIADGDSFLSAFLPKITGSAAFTNSVVFITFDEGTSNLNGGGHVLTIAISSGQTAVFSAGSTYNHYSTLRTIEQAWGLPLLGSAASASAIGFSGTAPTGTSQTLQAAALTPSSTATSSPTVAAPSPAATAAPDPTATPSPSATSWPPGATASRMDLLVPCSDTPDCYVYTVRAAGANGSPVDDDVPGIARYFGVSTDAIYALNPDAAAGIHPGELLKIPPPTR
jgi:hypothetical protein